MRIPRFYFPTPLQVGTDLELPPELFRHAIQVLRMHVGEPLKVFNGDGGEYHAELAETGRRSARIRISGFDPVERESTLHLTLVQALIKPDKMDFALQKAVELGVAAFQPLITQRSVVRTDKDKAEKKLSHWQAIANSACEQCGRTRVPVIHEPLTLPNYLAQATAAARLILAPGIYPRLATLPTPSPHGIHTLIGPEGGFTDEEVQTCLNAGVQAVSLGPRILRAVTASAAVLALLQARHGDL